MIAILLNLMRYDLIMAMDSNQFKFIAAMHLFTLPLVSGTNRVNLGRILQHSCKLRICSILNSWFFT